MRRTTGLDNCQSARGLATRCWYQQDLLHTVALTPSPRHDFFTNCRIASRAEYSLLLLSHWTSGAQLGLEKTALILRFERYSAICASKEGRRYWKRKIGGSRFGLVEKAKHQNWLLQIDQPLVSSCSITKNVNYCSQSRMMIGFWGCIGNPSLKA